MINLRFEIIKELGKGRSEVYLCKDLDFNNREVAIKFLPVDVSEEEIRSFRDEFFTLVKLDHPNIVKAFEISEVVDRGEKDPVKIGSKFIVLEYFESTGLSDYQFIGEEKILREILKQICSVLYYLHQSNYIYYDLKPENILISGTSTPPQIKLIDLGLAEFLPDSGEHVIKGTAQYIAPELLRKEAHDHRVDLYSLGIMLYQIIYNQFPFDISDELNIYKAQVEQEFGFPDSSQLNPDLVKIAKKLLKKDPEKRYQNSLQVVNDLGFEIDASLYHHFIPAKVFSGREDLVNILTNYINDKTSSEVFSVKGFDGAGKSALINHLYKEITGSILLSNMQGVTGINLIKYLLQRMILSPNIFSGLIDSEREQILSFLKKNDKDYLDELHSIISIITNKSKLVLLIDDYNLFDSFAAEVISTLIPILQVNGSKVIIAESSDFDYASESINNLRELLVSPFTEKQLLSYLQLAFYVFFPRELVQDLILRFADLLPGNVIDFIKDLINLQIIVFSKDGASLKEDLDKISGIEGSLSGIYDLRLSNLGDAELNIAKTISAFEIGIDRGKLQRILNIDESELVKIFSSLQYNNIIHPFNVNPVPVIISDGFKKHIYSGIENKDNFHAILANKINTNIPDFDRKELARQYEFAGDYINAYSIWMKEINTAKELAAYSYLRNILNHLINLPISNTLKNSTKYLLVETLYKLSDYNAALDIISQVNLDQLRKEELLELYIMKGSSLINISKLDEGMELINSILPEVVDEYRKSKMLVEIAYAKFDLNSIGEAAGLGRKILERQNVTDEDKGRIYNLLGLCVIYQNQDWEQSLREFFKSLNYYQKAKLTLKVAAIEVNIGNVYNLQGDTENAEKYWKNALKLNLSIGNIEQEGVLLINNGIYYYDKTEYDDCIEYYNRAHKIFLSLGNLKNQGIVLSNLGEVYLTTCEYQKSFDALSEAKEIFEELDNFEELIPVIVLLGIFYFTIGDHQLLSELHKKTLSLLENSQISEKYHLELLLIKNLYLIAIKENVQISEIETVRDNYFEKEDFKNYVTVQTILLNYLIELELLSKAEEELNSPSFIEVCNKNSIYSAYREYLLGKVTSEYKKDNALSPIEYFENAYELLKDKSITELTWKVLLALAVTYTKRGNFNKAKSFIIYTQDLINLIAQNIETTRFKTAYLQKKERQLAFDILEELHES